MALPVTTRFENARLFIGDGATPTEAFVAICGMTQMELTTAVNTGETVIPDCDNPALATAIVRDPITTDWSASFEGVLAKAALPTLEALRAAGGARNVRIHVVGLGTGAGTPDYRWSGPAITTWAITGEKGGRLTVAFTIQGAGDLTGTNVAALP
jgi:hypothetical protein